MAAAQLVAVGATPSLVGRDALITHTGDGTFYNPDLGACGLTNSDADFVVALGHVEFDSNSYCGRRLTATYQGKSVTVEVVDRCGGCNQYDLDFSPAAFKKLASTDAGRIHGVKWHFLAQ